MKSHTSRSDRVRESPTYFGNPIVSISQPARYLRHRAAAEAATRIRQRAIWRIRVGIALAAALMFSLIGREVYLLITAAGRTVNMSAQQETHRAATTVKEAADAAKAPSSVDPTVAALDDFDAGSEK